MDRKEKIKINHQKCILCGNCIDVCGSATLEIIDKKVVQTIPDLCSACGHCALVCPTDAISAVENSIHQFRIEKLSNELFDIEKILATKRSVRHFSNKKIDRETLQKLIEYAEKAPSSSNLRKRNYIIIDDREKILKLEKAVLSKYKSLLKILNPVLLSLIKLFSKNTYNNLLLTKKDILQMQKQFESKKYPIFRNAQAVVVIYAPKDLQTKDDSIIAQQYLMLYAHSIKIDSCVIGYAQWAHKTLEKFFNIPKGYQIYAVNTLGYSKFPDDKTVVYEKQISCKFL